MKVIVCGGRNYQNWKAMYNVLDELHQRTPITLVIQGGSPGADAGAAIWANTRGVRQEAMLANWGRYGRQAGPIRNITMINQHPDLVIAFPGGKGTANMIRVAKSFKVPVQIVEDENAHIFTPATHHSYTATSGSGTLETIDFTDFTIGYDEIEDETIQEEPESDEV